MPRIFAVGLRACGVAVALLLATADAAEKAPSLIGATREQVLARYGEPKSQMAAGTREILFFARERVVLRNGVVVEVEALPEEAPRAPAPSASTETPAAKETPSTSTTKAAEPESSAAQPTTPPPPPEPKLEFKSIRPPSSKAPSSAADQPPAKTERSTAPTPRRADITLPDSRPAAAPAAPVATQPVVTPSANAPGSSSVVSGRETATEPAPRTVETPVAGAPAEKAEEPAKTTEAEPKAEEAAPTPPPAKKAKAKAKAPVQKSPDGELPDVEAEGFGGANYVIAFIIIVGGGGYLVWRQRQRRLMLEATAVSRSPFAPAPAAGGGAVFTGDLLAKLEWKRFEELVACYYSKTGVVASRTKSGPASAVNIKISWKGESRPFACVKCISQSAGLVDVKPLQELHAVLATEDIRRGYVVTNGKFSVPARDFAEEKHITLMPGDIFLEKLNALPEAARSEIMQEVTAGDYTTPSCPRCEARMVRAPEDPSLWRCPVHFDQQLPGRK